MIARNMKLSLRALLITMIVGFSFEASALPLSPKWMKSAESIKKSQAGTSGELPDVTGGGGVQALPLPGSLWLIVIGITGIAAQRRTKSGA
jgi:hypothetical protein